MTEIHPNWLRSTKRPMPDPGEEERLGLSERQFAMLRMRSRGMTNKEVASALGYTVRTVEQALHEAYVKLGIRCPYPGPAATYLLGRYDERNGA